ncbi:12099_t:CDS:1, partial [Funneliformis mosseae]
DTNEDRLKNHKHGLSTVDLDGLEVAVWYNFPDMTNIGIATCYKRQPVTVLQ